MRGFSQLILLLVIFCLAIPTLFLTRANRYIYIATQHLSYRAGINLNNIAKNSYVEFIKSPQSQISSGTPTFLNSKVAASYKTQDQQEILGETASVDDTKWIEVDLSEQRLYMKENGANVNSFFVSTGKWSPTPEGEWRIWIKLTSTRMVGGSKALGTYYNLPNVPYTMYYDRGYGIHGAYWHNNFGNPMSHGCTNMKPEEAKIVFDFAQVGTRVIVHN